MSSIAVRHFTLGSGRGGLGGTTTRLMRGTSITLEEKPMKTFAFAAALALAAGGASAHDAGNPYRASGQRAGGPAYLANSETGGKVAPVRRRNASPSFQNGSNQHAGGPAAELNAGGMGSVSAQGTVYDPARTVPFGTARSGHAAGGPVRQ
jgi:hypothetical protein